MDMKLLLLAALVYQSLAILAFADTSFEDGKHYYSRDPHPPSTPKVSVRPPYGSGGGYGTPRHSSGTKPPANCGNPPKKSSPSHGSGYYRSPPTSTPSSPPVSTLPPSVPTPVVTPTTPPFDPNSPPFTLTPPGGSTPTIPGINPTPPFGFPPSPFPCIFWRNHPTLVWGLVGSFGTLGNTFGFPSFPGFGTNANVMQALSNTRTDGYGALYREGAAAMLNAMAHRRFPYSTNQVRDSFITALASNQAAGAQARVFQMANEGRIKA